MGWTLVMYICMLKGLIYDNVNSKLKNTNSQGSLSWQ